MAKKKITEIAAEMMADFLAAEGYELYNIEFVKEGKDWFLRVYVDMASGEGYIGTEDCEKVSRFLRMKKTLSNKTIIWKFHHREWTDRF